MLLKVVTEYRPACIVVAWDAREKTFRDELYEEYKAQRPHMPEGLSPSGRSCPSSWRPSASPTWSSPATRPTTSSAPLPRRPSARASRSIVVTGDRDAMQVVDDDIWVMSTGRGVTDVKIYTPSAVLERFGVTPAQIPDYIGLKGDSSDNIPGVPGIGEKTAAQLLQQFGSIEELYERLDEVKSEKRRALLREHEQAARLSLQLATMVLDVPLEHDSGRARHDVRLSASRRVCSTPSSSASSSAICAGASRRSPGRRPSRRPPPAPAAVAGGARASRRRAGRGPAGGAAREGRGGAGVRAPRRRRRPLGRRRCTPAATSAGGARRRRPRGARSGCWPRTSSRTTPRRSRASWRRPCGPAFDTAVAAYLLAPERPEKERALFALAGADDGAQLVEGPAAEAAAATRAVLTWRVAETQRPRLVELGLERLFREIELPLVARARRRWRPPASRWTRTASARSRPACATASTSCADEIARLAGGPFTIGSPQQLAEVLFGRLGLDPGRKGKTGYSTDARVLRGLRDQHAIIPRDRGVARAHQAPQHLPRAAARPASTRDRPAAHHLQPAGSGHRPALELQPQPAEHPRAHRAGGGDPRPASSPRRAASWSSPTTRRSSCASWRRCRGEPALLDAYHRGEDVHRVTAAAVAGIASRRSASASASAPRRPTSASCTASPPSASPSRSTSR